MKHDVFVFSSHFMCFTRIMRMSSVPLLATPLTTRQTTSYAQFSLRLITHIIRGVEIAAHCDSLIIVRYTNTLTYLFILYLLKIGMPSGAELGGEFQREVALEWEMCEVLCIAQCCRGTARRRHG